MQNTGSVSFDRNVYPVPFGINTTTSNFAEHATAADSDLLPQGDTIVHVRVTDADYNVSAMGEDTIADTTVAVKLQRGLQFCYNSNSWNCRFTNY